MSRSSRPAIGGRAGVLVSAGILEAGGGHASLRVHYTCGRRTVTDGPFVETKALFGG